jgi:hypothetical protein
MRRKEMNKKIKCITEYPFINVQGFGKFKKGDKLELPEKEANRLLNDKSNWKEDKEKKKKEEGKNGGKK